MKNVFGFSVLVMIGILSVSMVGCDPLPEGMVLIPAGEFEMGSGDPESDNDEQPVHIVYVDAFYMDKYEVTNLEYQQFVLANPRWGKDRIENRFHYWELLADTGMGMTIQTENRTTQ